MTYGPVLSSFINQNILNVIMSERDELHKAHKSITKINYDESHIFALDGI